jgi:DNA-directed RNA polymerase subunit RPC12/RpoP
MGTHTAPVNRHSALVNHIHFCPLCGMQARAALAKTGRAYLSCRSCMTRIFFNTDRAVDAMMQSAVVQGRISGYASRVKSAFNQLANSLDVEMAQKQIVQWSGKRCVICGSRAMPLWDRKKRPYQRCYFCGSFVFLHSPLGVAGLSIRSRLKDGYR